jgi:hypothetical protein
VIFGLQNEVDLLWNYAVETEVGGSTYKFQSNNMCEHLQMLIKTVKTKLKLQHI